MIDRPNVVKVLPVLETFRQVGRASLVETSPRRTVLDSRSIEGGYAGVRSACPMLVGRSDEGKKLRARWALLHGAPMDASLYEPGAEQMAGIYCRPAP